MAREKINGITGELIEDAVVDYGMFYDEVDAMRHIYRKRDRHKTKGKRKVKGDYRYDLYI